MRSLDPPDATRKYPCISNRAPKRGKSRSEPSLSLFLAVAIARLRSDSFQQFTCPNAFPVFLLNARNTFLVGSRTTLSSAPRHHLRLTYTQYVRFCISQVSYAYNQDSSTGAFVTGPCAIICTLSPATTYTQVIATIRLCVTRLNGNAVLHVSRM